MPSLYFFSSTLITFLHSEAPDCCPFSPSDVSENEAVEPRRPLVPLRERKIYLRFQSDGTGESRFEEAFVQNNELFVPSNVLFVLFLAIRFDSFLPVPQLRSTSRD